MTTRRAFLTQSATLGVTALLAPAMLCAAPPRTTAERDAAAFLARFPELRAGLSFATAAAAMERRAGAPGGVHRVQRVPTAPHTRHHGIAFSALSATVIHVNDHLDDATALRTLLLAWGVLHVGEPRDAAILFGDGPQNAREARHHGFADAVLAACRVGAPC